MKYTSDQCLPMLGAMIDVAQMTNKMVFGTWSQVGEKILPGDISITRGVSSVRKMQPQPLNRSI